MRDAMQAGLLGFIDTPAQGNIRPAGVVWCADNGCFGRGYPGESAWFGWLGRQAADAGTCAFAVAPDVVGDAKATLERSEPWLGSVRELGFPVALVAQNGIEHTPIPWDAIDVIFLGGSAECVPCDYVRTAGDWAVEACPDCKRHLTEWKLGALAAKLTAEAKVRGKKVHMGRVNSARRYWHAVLIGCNSADGTYITYGPDINLPKALGWRAQLDASLFGGVA